jgi:hypothetical protein
MGDGPGGPQGPETLPPPDVEAMRTSGFFAPPVVHRYVWSREYTAEEYLALLSTYSGHGVGRLHLDCCGPAPRGCATTTWPNPNSGCATVQQLSPRGTAPTRLLVARLHLEHPLALVSSVRGHLPAADRRRRPGAKEVVRAVRLPVAAGQGVPRAGRSARRAAQAQLVPRRAAPRRARHDRNRRTCDQGDRRRSCCQAAEDGIYPSLVPWGRRSPTRSLSAPIPNTRKPPLTSPCPSAVSSRASTT